MNFNNIGNNNVREVNLIMYMEISLRKDLISQGIKVISQLKGQTKYRLHLALNIVRDMVILLGLSP